MAPAPPGRGTVFLCFFFQSTMSLLPRAGLSVSWKPRLSSPGSESKRVKNSSAADSTAAGSLEMLVSLSPKSRGLSAFPAPVTEAA